MSENHIEVNRFNIPDSLEEKYEPFKIPSVHKSLLVLSDIHVPYHNFRAICNVLEFCQNKKIDSVLINGDFLDFYQLSKWVKDPRKRDAAYEIDTGNAMLDAFDMAFPDVKKFFKMGNHDERYEKYLFVKAPELLGIKEFRLDNLLRLPARGITYINDQRIVFAGGFPIIHGHEVNMRNTTVNPARTLFLKSKHSAMCGHLHVASQHSGKQQLNNKVISTWSTGHLSEEHPPYARNNEWILGFAIVDFDNEFFEVSNYKIIDGKIYRS